MSKDPLAALMPPPKCVPVKNQGLPQFTIVKPGDKEFPVPKPRKRRDLGRKRAQQARCQRKMYTLEEVA